MSVSVNEASTLQAATTHQCSRDADGDGEGGRNGYPSDSVEAALIRDKFDVVPSEDHDQMHEDAFDSEETPCTSSDTDGEGVGATFGAQRGAAVGLCAGKKDRRYTSCSCPGREDRSGVKHITTFADDDKCHSSSRSDSQGVGASRPRRTAAVEAQRAMTELNRRAPRSVSQRDQSSHLMADARPLEAVKRYVEKSQPDMGRSDNQSVDVSKPKRSVSVKAQRDDEVIEQCLDVEQDDDSDAYVSSVEEFSNESESDSDDDVLYQLCEPEPVVERAQARSTCRSEQSLLLQQLLQSDRQQPSLSQSDKQQLSRQLLQLSKQ